MPRGGQLVIATRHHTDGRGEEWVRLSVSDTGTGMDEQVRTRIFELLLSDVVMPRMNGHELAAELTRLSPELRVMHMSGYPGSDALRDAATPFLHKPFSAGELLRRVRETLEARQWPTGGTGDCKRPAALRSRAGAIANDFAAASVGTKLAGVAAVRFVVLFGLFALSLAACGGAGAEADLGDADPAAADDAAPTATADAATAADAASPADAGARSTPDGAISKPDAAPPPSFDSIPWETGATVGAGVSRKDTLNPLGDNVFVGYAGYNVTLSSAQAWVSALYHARLGALGVRWVFAVQGPADPGYNGLEIGNSKIAAALAGGEVGPRTQFVLVAGHSSGSFVADELLQQLASGADPQGVTAGKVVYFDLDGDQKYVTAAGIARLRKAYYVGARDGTTLSPNHSVMQSLGGTYASSGGFFEYDAGSSGCNAGAIWCVHVSLINTHPHNPATGDPLLDYSDFGGRPVNVFWLDTKRTEAGLMP